MCCIIKDKNRLRGDRLLDQRETEVLNLIKENPFISQSELSKKLGLTASSVSRIIADLVHKEFIQGQAYVLNEEFPIVCVGAANIDKKFFVHEKLIHGTSNPIDSAHSVGGVVRNIAENLGRLGQNVALITTRGDDAEWLKVKEASEAYINLDFTEIIEGKNTGAYTALINREGEMEYGFADMSIYDEFTPEVLIRQTYILKRAKCIVADLNVPKVTLEFLVAYAEKHDIKLVFIPVSGPKMERLPDYLEPVDWLIVNRDETEAQFNMVIQTDEDLMEGAKLWNARGVSNVIVTNGSKSLAYASKDYEKIYPIKKSNRVVDVTGAGDSFSSAVIYGWLNGYSIDDCIELGMVNSTKTIETDFTVRQDLTEKQLKLDLEAYRNESFN